MNEVKDIAARSPMMLSCVMVSSPYCEHNFKNDEKKEVGCRAEQRVNSFVVF